MKFQLPLSLRAIIGAGVIAGAIFFTSLVATACGNTVKIPSPELYSWEQARDSIKAPSTAWLINCGSPLKAVYRFGEDRLAPGVASADSWLIEAFHLWEFPIDKEDLPDYWLNPSYGSVVTLEKVIADAELRLGPPPSKRQFTVSLPIFASRDILPAEELNAMGEEVIQYIDRVREMVSKLDCPHLEFIGFNAPQESSVPENVRLYLDACHEGLFIQCADISFDYRIVEDIMDQPGVKSIDGKNTLKDVPELQAGVIRQMEAVKGDVVTLDCGDAVLLQLQRSPYESDQALLQQIYQFINSINK